jgi:hypothetical protein
LLVLVNQHGEILVAAEADLLAAAALGALQVAAPAPRQLSMVAAFEEHRLSGVRTFPAEVWAD